MWASIQAIENLSATDGVGRQEEEFYVHAKKCLVSTRGAVNGWSTSTHNVMNNAKKLHTYLSNGVSAITPFRAQCLWKHRKVDRESVVIRVLVREEPKVKRVPTRHQHPARRSAILEHIMLRHLHPAGN